MIAALEFYVRSLNLRDNLPIPCSFCIEGNSGDRKVVTLNEAYRHPEQIAVRQWSLTDCEDNQALPALQEQIILREEVFDSKAVVMCEHAILDLVNGVTIPSSRNFRNRPMPLDQYLRYYDTLLTMERQLFIKETWVWREFLKVYLPLMYSMMFGERDEFDRLREAMLLISQNQPELWHKWLRWKKYMLDMPGLPGEIVFHEEYDRTFRFV